MNFKKIDEIVYPQDIKKLATSELYLLAKELRKIIINVVSKNGGHLASSLGTVELTLALHYVFSPLKDKIIWDVGHQSYSHKILTGRKKQFETLRKLNGISGFSKRNESLYDPLTSGHSSTSISAGLGIASAKHLKGEFSKILTIIGDGSLTAGIAYEGLNQIGQRPLNGNMVVILNDNDMSISKNVGALSNLLSKKYSKTQLSIIQKKFTKSILKIKNNIHQFTKKTKNLFKHTLAPSLIFEALNLEYFGPINGHNMNHLINIFKKIKNKKNPTLLHVVTKKGKGYTMAERNPIYFHGIGSFDIPTGFSKNNKKTYTNIFGNTMIELATNNHKIIAITAAMSEGTGLELFKEYFPDRFFDIGIAEQHGVAFAAGMATEGFIPVVAIYSTFLQRAYDQILHDVCIENLSVIFAIDRGGIVGEDGPTHHGLFDLSYLRNIPNMVIMAPKNENELKNMLYTAVLHKGPISLRYPKGNISGVVIDSKMTKIPIGKGEILSIGKDILLIGIGNTVSEAIIAASYLKNKYNIYATVVNARFVKPLDRDLFIKLGKRFRIIITIEENILEGGFGSAILELLADYNIKINIFKRIGIKNTFVEHGKQEELRSKYCINFKFIVKSALEALKIIKKTDLI